MDPLTMMLLAAGGDGGDSTASWQALRVFGAAALIVTLAMLATSRRFYRLQRIRVVAALVSGGWLAIGVGFLLGPSMLAAVDAESMLEIRPILMIGLGWIGVIVGMQARAELIRLVPGLLWRWTLIDLAMSVAVLGAAAGALLLLGFPESHRTVAWALIPLATLAACTIGWAPETRSLHVGHEPRTMQLTALIKGGSGLAAMFAIVLIGMAHALVGRDPDGAMEIQPVSAALSMSMAALLAVFLGVSSRLMLNIAGSDRSQALVVFLGVVCVVAGVAAELTFSPLFSAMLAGAVIANLSGPPLRRFEWFLLRAEHAVAIMFYVLAGIMLRPGIGAWGWSIVILLVAGRLLLKPMLMRRMVRKHAAELPARTRLLTASSRQSPVAIAIAVGLVLIETSVLHMLLLTIVVMVGLFSDLLPIVMTLIGRVASGSTGQSERPAVSAMAGRVQQ